MTNLTYSLLVGHFLLIMEYFSRNYNGYDDEDDENAYIYHNYIYYIFILCQISKFLDFSQYFYIYKVSLVHFIFS